MLEIKKLSKTYNKGKKAVDNLSLHIEKGEIYGFIGRNGAGKTTTIRCIIGALNFDEGEILIDGISIKDDPVSTKKLLAYIPDNPNLYGFLTGIQYINFIADVFEVKQDERKDRVKKYADKLELTNSLEDLISSYSHGMKQKLAIIAAVVHKPKLLILDEPFVGLDPVATLALREVMHELCDEGTAIFFSTHVLEVAEKLCDKIAIIKSGELVANGTVKEVCQDKSLSNLFMELTEKVSEDENNNNS